MASGAKHQMPGGGLPPEFPEAGAEDRDLWFYVQTLTRRRWWFLAGLLAVLGAVIAYNELTMPVWGAQAKLLISSTSAGSPLSASANLTTFLPGPFGGGMSTQYNTQVEILQSRQNLEKAAAFLEHKPELIRSITEGKRRQLTPRDIQELIKNAPANQAAQPSLDVDLRAIMRSISVDMVEQTTIMQIQAFSADVQLAHDYVNALCAVYLVDALERTRQAASSALDYIGDEIEDAEGQLAEAGTALAEFGERTGIVDLDARAKVEIERVAALQGRLLDARKDTKGKRAQLAEARRQLTQQEDEVRQSWTTTTNPRRDALEQQLVELTVSRSNALEKYTDGSNKIRQIDAEIASVREALANEVDQVERSSIHAQNPVKSQLLGRVVGLQAEIKAGDALTGVLRAALAEAENDLQAFPQSQIELAGLRRELELADAHYRMLSKSKQEYLLMERAQTSGAELLEPAVLSETFIVSPRKHLNLLMGLMAGAMLGLILAFAIEFMDDTYIDSQAAEADLGLPLISMVPAVKRQAEELLYTDIPDRSFKESFLTLQSNIGFATPGGAPGSIMVTSSQPGDGKTTIAANLAVAAAQANLRVVLVDADLRRPRCHEFFGLARSPGLSNVLTEQTKLEDCLQTVPVDEGNELTILPAGPAPPTPQVLLDSERMAELLDTLRRQADLLIIDAPPAGEMSDAQILGSKVEAALLVFSVRGTRRPLLRTAHALLARAGANVVGLVLNRASKFRDGFYYSYDYPEEPVAKEA